MNWRIDYSRDSDNFIGKHKIQDVVREELKKFLLKMTGESINIDLKKLEGDWDGYYRIRKGKLRIIFEIDRKKNLLFVEQVDFRGSVYK